MANNASVTRGDVASDLARGRFEMGSVSQLTFGLIICFFSFAAYSHTTPRGKNAVHRHACRLASSDRAFADAAPTRLAVFAAFFAAAFSSLLADDASTRFACNASLLARFSPTRNSEHCPGTRPSSAHNVASPACRRFQLRLASLRLGLGLLERRL